MLDTGCALRVASCGLKLDWMIDTGYLIMKDSDN